MSSNVIAILPKQRGRKAEWMPDCIRALPRRHKNRYWEFIYAIGFAGGVVKIGMTRSPRDRIRTHFRNAKGDVQWVHLFPAGPAGFGRIAEQRATYQLKEFAKQINFSEWFYATDKAAVISAVRAVITAARDDALRNEVDRARLRGRQARAFALLAEEERRAAQPAVRVA
jgi:hypothetical protein